MRYVHHLIGHQDHVIAPYAYGNFISWDSASDMSKLWSLRTGYLMRDRISQAQSVWRGYLDYEVAIVIS